MCTHTLAHSLTQNAHSKFMRKNKLFERVLLLHPPKQLGINNMFGWQLIVRFDANVNQSIFNVYFLLLQRLKLIFQRASSQRSDWNWFMIHWLCCTLLSRSSNTNVIWAHFSRKLCKEKMLAAIVNKIIVHYGRWCLCFRSILLKVEVHSTLTWVRGVQRIMQYFPKLQQAAYILEYSFRSQCVHLCVRMCDG